MKLGVMSAIYGDKSWEQACKAAKAAGLKAIEPGVGGFVGKMHADPSLMLKEPEELDRFTGTAKESGLDISALACHGNPLHPDRGQAEAHTQDLLDAVEVAKRANISVITCFAGCPGAGQDAKYPNWITCPWPPYFGEAVKWQWEKKVIPFWKEMAQKGQKAGVSFAFEMHPGDVVYNPETLLKLKQEVGSPAIACNFDPSHLFWQAIDPIVAINLIGDMIVHVHAKDTKLNDGVVRYRGVNDWKHYGEIAKRAWNFRTVGYGHSHEFWNDFVSALRLAGYDGVISIEHEDPLMSVDEGLDKAIQFLSGVILCEKPGRMWWA